MGTSLLRSQLVETGDGVHLYSSQSGPVSNPEILFIHGWRQSAALWHKQVSHFQNKYHITTYDLRGHGQSAKPSFGHRVYRHAADLKDLLIKLDLKDANIIAHAVGCPITFAFWDLFPELHTRIRSIVLIDESACIVANPSWTAEQAQELASLFTPTSVYELANSLSADAASITSIVKRTFLPSISQKDIDFVVSENLKTNPETAAQFFIDLAFNDFRDVLPRVSVPTLVVGARGSLVPVDAMRHIASQIPRAKCEIIEVEDGGSHFPFYEGPEKFNQVVEEFLEAL